MQEMLSREGVIELLKKRQGGLSLRAFALQLGISAAYLSDVYLAKCEPGPALLEPLGLERQVERTVVYVKKNRQVRKSRPAGNDRVVA